MDLRLEEVEMAALVKVLGLSDEYLFETGMEPKGQPLQVAPARKLKTGQLVYQKEFDFRNRLSAVRNCGGAMSQAAQLVVHLFEEVRQGLNPFPTLTSRQDARIDGARIYSLSAECEMVMIESEASTTPAFIGTPNEVKGWVAAHEGLVITLSTETGRYATTRTVKDAATADLNPPALTASMEPLLQQVKDLDLEDLVPPRKIRESLLMLDSASTDDDIRDTLEMVADADVRSLLFDLTNLLRSGDHKGAEARMRLRHGDALPVADAGVFAQDAAESGANSDQALLINSMTREELERLLDPARFQDWMLFLHPDQQHLALAEYDRPMVLTGVSGSGKTCVLVHRARHLARKYPGQRIGILTLSGDLAGLLQNLVNHLLSEDERKNVTVRTFYDVFSDCLKHLGPEKYFAQLGEHVDSTSHLHTVLKRAQQKWPRSMVWDCDPVSKATVDEEWEEFYMSRNPTLKEWMEKVVKYLEDWRVDASRYLEEELALIRSQFPVPSRREYLNTEKRNIRAGRAIEFRKELRQDVLRLLLFWEEWLLEGGMIDDLGLTQALMPLYSEMVQMPEALRFRCLLVDEFQDFSTLDLQLLRRIVPVAESDALFLCGDMVQRILVKRQSLDTVGLTQGPAIRKSIFKNYRNSRQVLLAASRLANRYGAIANSQEEEIEVLNPELAQRDSNPPIILQTEDQIEKAWEIVLECCQGGRGTAWTVCIATAAPKVFSVDSILRYRPAGVAARALSGDCILNPEEVVVSHISQLKGFEFRLVLILGCDAGDFPEAGVPEYEGWRDALRLYVAMTRARDQVYLIHGENRSEFISVFDDTVIYREEPGHKPYTYEIAVEPQATEKGQAGKPAADAKGPLPAPPAKPQRLGQLDPDGRCTNWFTEAESETLHRYFASFVYREGLSFAQWLRPGTLAGINAKNFCYLRKCRPEVVSSILTKLETHGLAAKR